MVNPSTPRYSYQTRILPYLSGPESLNEHGLEISLQFFNQLRQPVSVSDRMGVRVSIPHQAQSVTTFYSEFKPTIKTDCGPCFVIRRRITLKSDVKLDINDLSNVEGFNPTDEMRAYMDSILRRPVPGRGNTHSFYIEYQIPKSDFDLHGGDIYLHNLDLQLSINPPQHAKSHPHSIPAVRQRMEEYAREVTASTKMSDAFVMVKIVDRRGGFGVRYMKVHDQVVAIAADKFFMDGIPDGVYVISGGGTNSDLLSTTDTVKYYNFEDADKLPWLFTSYAQAVTLGNPNDLLKRENEEKAQTLKLAELELREERIAQEREFECQRDQIREVQLKRQRENQAKDELNAKFEILRQFREERERERNKQSRENSEKRITFSREVSEYLRFIPAVMLAVTNLFQTVKKY